MANKEREISYAENIYEFSKLGLPGTKYLKKYKSCR